jgi:hypothetical protein
MQRWSAVLEEEMSAWPGVTHRPMFGLIGYYRDQRIFAAIPRTRAADTPFSLLIKLHPTAQRHPSTQNPPAGDPASPRSGDPELHPTAQRVAKGAGPGSGWMTLAMESEADLAHALQLLGRAYEKARVRSRPPGTR